MNRLGIKLEPVRYAALNAKQKENFNFQKISALLADYGFTTIRLSDDWQGADFIANHIDWGFIKVQLKSVLCVDAKYVGKDVWISFNYKKNGIWYLYPYDDFFKWAWDNQKIKYTSGFKGADNWRKSSGRYTWPSINDDILGWLRPYALVPISTLSISLQVDADAACAFQQAAPIDKSKIESLINLYLHDFVQKPSKPLMQVMDEIGDYAKSKGMNQEVLDALLSEDKA